MGEGGDGGMKVAPKVLDVVVALLRWVLKLFITSSERHDINTQKLRNKTREAH